MTPPSNYLSRLEDCDPRTLELAQALFAAWQRGKFVGRDGETDITWNSLHDPDKLVWCYVAFYARLWHAPLRKET